MRNAIATATKRRSTLNRKTKSRRHILLREADALTLRFSGLRASLMRSTSFGRLRQSRRLRRPFKANSQLHLRSHLPLHQTFRCRHLAHHPNLSQFRPLRLLLHRKEPGAGLANRKVACSASRSSHLFHCPLLLQAACQAAPHHRPAHLEMAVQIKSRKLRVSRKVQRRLVCRLLEACLEVEEVMVAAAWLATPLAGPS